MSPLLYQLSYTATRRICIKCDASRQAHLRIGRSFNFYAWLGNGTADRIGIYQPTRSGFSLSRGRMRLALISLYMMARPACRNRLKTPSTMT